MEKINFKFLDIPIIRSCNLGCGGCLTFSDSKKIKGLVKLEESLDWLKFWSERLNPEEVTVFGGEPLLHPQFLDWCIALRKFWPNAGLRINTNGYYLNTLFDKVDALFTTEIKPQFIVSIQTGHDPYYTMVLQNVENLKNRVLDSLQRRYPSKKVNWNLWLDEPEIFKSWWRIDIDNIDSRIRITTCEQHKIWWQAHYQGFEKQLLPFYHYDDVWYTENHQFCQAKSFVNLYKGKLFKCPTVAVLQHTLETFELMQNSEWKPYLQNYNCLDTSATNEQITNWFKTQQMPEKVCNMCGFAGPKWTNGHLNRHELKENWKFEIIPVDQL